jgi:hypothetical protein
LEKNGEKNGEKWGRKWGRRKMGEKWGQTGRSPFFSSNLGMPLTSHQLHNLSTEWGQSRLSPFFTHFSLAAPVFALFEGWALGTTVAEGFSEPGGSKAQDVGGIVPTLRTSRRMGQPKF